MNARFSDGTLLFILAFGCGSEPTDVAAGPPRAAPTDSSRNRPSETPDAGVDGGAGAGGAGGADAKADASKPVPTNVLGASDFVLLGFLEPVGGSTFFSYGAFAARKVGGAVHFFLLQDAHGNYAPAEYVDPTQYDASGNCLSATCYSMDPAAATAAPMIANAGGSAWGTNLDGSAYDPYHGVLGQAWDSGVLENDCASSNCIPWSIYLPRAYPNRLYVTYGLPYGNARQTGGLMMMTLDTSSDGVTGPVTHAYGAWTAETPSGVVPMDPSHGFGLVRSVYMLDMPDGSMGHGSSLPPATQQGNGPDGPTLFSRPLPGPDTPGGLGSPPLLSDRKWLNYYTLTGGRNGSWPGQNFDGTLPPGQEIWSARHPGYAYVWEGEPCSLNPAAPGCGGPYPFVTSQGANMAIDPQKNGGTGTWGESDNAAQIVWIETKTKHGVLALVNLATSHLAGNTTACTTQINGKTVNVAHNWYCSGSGTGVSGRPCAGVNGDQLSPSYRCKCVDCSTGPSDTAREPAWWIYDPADLTAVKDGKKADYTAEPAVRIYPLSDISDKIPYGSLGSEAAMSSGGAWYDPDTQNLYVSQAQAVPIGVNAKPSIAVFHVKD